MASTLTKLERALREQDEATLAGEKDMYAAWDSVIVALREKLQREADTAARNTMRITGSVSATYEIKHTDGTVAVTGTAKREG